MQINFELSTPRQGESPGSVNVRVQVLNIDLPLPVRTARMDLLPEHYRVQLPKEINDARKQFKQYLSEHPMTERQGTG